jgi:tetratricopeptide (TPR) repeat protein
MRFSVYAPGARLLRVTGTAALVVAVAVVGLSLPAAADPSDEYSDTIAEDDDYKAGKAAIDAKNWDQAAKRLSRAVVRYPDNADLHNYLGFAYRNLKQMDRAFAHYKRALAIDPRHRGAHEYIGEAYLQVGDLAGAQKHLVELQAICLLPCEELADLDKAVMQHRRSMAPGAPSAKAQ